MRVALALLCVLAPATVSAEERRLTSADIQALLADNTARGEHRGRATRQYFDPNGRTLYQTENGGLEAGRWSTAVETDKYCSHWAMGGWSCYDVLTDGEVYFWFQKYDSGDDYRSPFYRDRGLQHALLRPRQRSYSSTGQGQSSGTVQPVRQVGLVIAASDVDLKLLQTQRS